MDGRLDLTTAQVQALREAVIRQRMRRHREHRLPMLYLDGPLDGMRSTIGAWLIAKPGAIISHRIGGRPRRAACDLPAPRRRVFRL